jgi:hypothetical protein
MADPINIKRLRSENLAADKVSLPVFPRLPERFIVRYPEMQQWQGEVELWRQALINEINSKMGQPSAGPQ